MSKLPVVAIVGRPNVGKSSLLNCLARSRISIVESTPGVTRDRVSALVTHEDVTMEVVDTGGIGIVDRDDLEDQVEQQIEFAIRGANVILMVTDVRQGVTPLDREVAKRLRPRAAEIAVILVVNKVDHDGLEAEAAAFYSLGLGAPLTCSAKEGHNRDELLRMVTEKVWPTGKVDTAPVMKLAVVGRRNVGKSTFVNALAREERMIVSEIPGTTRDAVDVRFQKDGREFIVIDTAGMQRRTRLKDSIEFYSQVRTLDAIQRADVVLLLLDASDEVSRADKKLGELIGEAHRVAVVVANKWDLMPKNVTTERYDKYLLSRLPGLSYAPVVFTTATDAKNIQSVIDLSQNLYRRASEHITTGELNRVLEAIRAQQQPRVKGSKVPKLFYGTQVAVCPPVFLLFVNEPSLFSPQYRRYVANALREAFKLDEIPIRVLLRRRESIYHE